MIDRSQSPAVALVIYAGFANLLRKGQAAPLRGVEVCIAPTRHPPCSATSTRSLCKTRRTIRQAERTQGIQGRMRQVQVTLVQRPWYNPDFNGRWFFVPGVIATITLVMVVNLTAFAVVREREVGTLEQIMVSPFWPAEFILGKTVPFFVVGMGLAGLVTIVGIVWFQIPFVGNPLVFLLGTTIYMLSLLALGLLISTVCSTQQQAFATNFFVVNPLFTLSGFSFPISSMPEFMQWLTYVNPLRYYLIVIRGTFLKGIGLSILWPQMLAMAAIAAVLMTFCILRFRKSLE